MPKNALICPHCNEPLLQWEPSPESGWDHDLFYCGNDECAYFLEGRRKICRESEKNFAYRFCYDPAKDKTFPLVTWCSGDLSLLKGRCVD